VAGPAPRRDRELSLDRIAAAAIVVADRDGFSEVTMRRVAIELGVATMSLYRHVTSRDDLTVAMINAAIGDLRLPPRHPRGWRASLELCARLEWAMFQRHPWLGPSMSLTRPQLALNAMRLSEWVMGAFDGTALSLPERMFVQTTVFSFVRGVASALEPEAEAVRDSGITAEQWMETQETAFSTVMSSADFTYFQRLTQERFDLDLDSLFAFGLARLLDGIETFVRSREERSPGVSDSRRSR
jgi:AcrR family transcriptional regulator